jgi:putative flippase GtrA
LDEKMARIGLLYSIFALIALIANLGAQALSVWIYRGAHAIALSILAGTGVGLLIKYILDKRYIFLFKTDGLAHNSRLFTIYTCMGLVTTALFWTVEFAFHVFFATDLMRYLGGALGLTLGYLLKYQLDKHFVFVNEARDMTGIL